MNAELIENKRPTYPVTRSCMILGMFVFAFLSGLVVIWSSVYDRNSRHIYPKAEMKRLEIAIKGYKTEYLRLPFGTEARVRDNEPFDTTDANGRTLLDILLAKNTAQNQ